MSPRVYLSIRLVLPVLAIMVRPVRSKLGILGSSRRKSRRSIRRIRKASRSQNLYFRAKISSRRRVLRERRKRISRYV